MSARSTLTLIVAMATCTSVFADQRVAPPRMSASNAPTAILIGGGYGIAGSQVQIERNTAWMQQVLNEHQFNVRTWFTDGDAPEADVHERLAASEDVGPLDTLALVFGDELLERTRYRNHELEHVEGSTRRDHLVPALKSALKTEQPVFMIYAGHGTPTTDLAQPELSSLSLWDDTALNAAELSSLLDGRTAPTRFIFTQCYSGGFHELAYQSPMTPRSVQSCGFTSESAWQPSEGCSASINTNDYRDYISYFFSAVSGYGRNGQIITRDPDLDRNGALSYREAHLYALEDGYNTDLARSSSEDFLERWEPWYLSWMPQPDFIENNEYARIYRALAEEQNIPLDGRAAGVIREQLEVLDQNLLALQDQQFAVDQAADEARRRLHGEAFRRWPELQGPYTAAFQTLVKADALPLISEWLALQADFPTLKAALERSELLNKELLDAERQRTQLYKLLRLRRLAQLKQWLYERGSEKDVAAYEALLDCENAELPDRPSAPMVGRQFALPEEP